MDGDDRPRNSYFDQPYEPFRNNPSSDLNQDEIRGPFPNLNPTSATLRYVGAEVQRIDSHGSEYVMSQERIDFDESASTTVVEYAWTARNNRKGRHAVIIHETCGESHSRKQHPKSQLTGIQAVLRNLRTMFTTFAWYNISWVNAVTLVFGCLTFVANGFLSLLPHAMSQYHSPPGAAYVQATLSIFGSMLFVYARFLSFTEAVSANRDGCFGWKAHSIAYVNETDNSTVRGSMTSLSPDKDACQHYHSDKSRLFGHRDQSWDGDDVEKAMERATRPSSHIQSWRWLPTAHEFRRHFVYEIGCMANAVLLISSIVYCAASVAALGTTGATANIPRWIRLPQLMGAGGFVLGSIVLMAENQAFWLRPNPWAIGWHINLFVAMGSLGLLLCAIFGLLVPSPESRYLFSVSYLWSMSN